MPYRPVSRQPRVMARVAVRQRTPWWFELPLVLVSTVIGAAFDQVAAGLLSGVTFILFRRLRAA